MYNYTLIPGEIWLEIIHWATVPSKFDSGAAYKPFQRRSPLPAEIHDPSWHTRASLALVCRRWRCMVAEHLYHDIVFGRGVAALKQVLEEEEPLRRLVQCAILPYGSTIPGPNADADAIKMLNLCTELRTLVRPLHTSDCNLTFEYDSPVVTFPSLQRLDWWYLGEADQSGGINSLSDVLRNAPNLEYLFVGGVTRAARVSLSRNKLHLPRLQTLRLHSINVFLLHQILSKWQLPSLQRMVLDAPLIEEGLFSIWGTFGHQLRFVEFGKNIKWLIADYLSVCLKGCPSLEEFHYFLFFTVHPATTDIFPSITTIGLHAAVNSIVNEQAVWNMIGRHFDAFSGPMFPNLRRLKLYGPWSGILAHPEFASFRNKMIGRNCQLDIIPDCHA